MGNNINSLNKAREATYVNAARILDGMGLGCEIPCLDDDGDPCGEVEEEEEWTCLSELDWAWENRISLGLWKHHDRLQNEITIKYTRMIQDNIHFQDNSVSGRLTPKYKDVLQELNLNEMLMPPLAVAMGVVDMYNDQMEADAIQRGENMDIKAPYHWGVPIGKSGSAYITFENYARGDKKTERTALSPLPFFRMYDNCQCLQSWQASHPPSSWVNPFGLISFTLEKEKEEEKIPLHHDWVHVENGQNPNDPFNLALDTKPDYFQS